MEEETDEPAVVISEPPAVAPVEAAAEKATPAESRSRKKVTFDLDLQVHTIPNRIPIYERRPAANTAYARPQQPLAFVPRPLDLKGKDRYLLGATTTKKIIDLFSLPNGFPSYPMPPKPGAKKGRAQGGSAQAMANASNPYYTFANFRTSKISRAAMNLKQITAALGEHFDSSVYKEWESSKRVQASLPNYPSAVSRHGTRSAGNIVNELGVSQTRRGGNAIAAFSPSRLRVHHQQPPSAVQPPKPNLSPTPPRGHYSSHSASHSDVPSSPPESWDRQRLPSVVSEQLSLNSRSQPPRRRSAASDSALYHLRRGGSPADGSPAEGIREPPGTERDRPPSRCSTIDTYVISDVAGLKQGPNSPGTGPGSSLGTRSAGTSSGHRRVIIGPNSRSVAWEAGISIPINEPVLNVSAIRTSPTAQDGAGLVQWQVTSRPPNLST